MGSANAVRPARAGQASAAAAALGPGMGSANAIGPARAGHIIVSAAAAALGPGRESAIAVDAVAGPQERV